MRLDFSIEQEEQEIELRKPDGTERVLRIACLDLKALEKIQDLEEERSKASGSAAIAAMRKELQVLAPNSKPSDFDGIPIAQLGKLIESMLNLATGAAIPDAVKKNIGRQSSGSSRSSRRAYG